MKRVLLAALVAITLAGCGDVPASRTALYGRALEATVRVSRLDGAHGSGVFISPRLVLTAAHVVGDQPSLIIYPEKGKPRNGQPVWVDKKHDLALIYVVDPGPNYLKLRCEQPRLGAPVFLVGHPAWLRSVVFAGYVASNKLQGYKTSPMLPKLVIDITGIPGNSGGPVIDKQGRVVGILTNAVLFHTYGGMARTAALVPVLLAVPGNEVCDVLRMHGWRR